MCERVDFFYSLPFFALLFDFEIQVFKTNKLLIKIK